MAGNEIGLTFQVVPDGTWEYRRSRSEPATVYCRLSLVVRPAFDDQTTTETTLPLEKFPSAVIDLLSKKISGNNLFELKRPNPSAIETDLRPHAEIEILTPQGEKRVRLDALDDHAADLQAWKDMADLVWAHIFDSGQGYPSFDDLMASLRRAFYRSQEEMDVSTSSEGQRLLDNDPFNEDPGTPSVRFEPEDYSETALLLEFLQSASSIADIAFWVRGNGARVDSAPLKAALQYLAQEMLDVSHGTSPEDELQGLLDRQRKTETIQAEFDRYRKQLGSTDQCLRNFDIDFTNVLREVEDSFDERNKTIKEYAQSQAERAAKAMRMLNGELPLAVDREVPDASRATGSFEPRPESDIVNDAIVLMSEMLDRLSLFNESFRPLSVDALSDVRSRYNKDHARHLLTARDTRFAGTGPAANAPLLDPKNDDPALRRLSAVSNLPRLAKFLGLTIDIDVPIEYMKPEALTNGVATVYASAGEKNQTVTAYKLDGDYFGPASRADTGQVNILRDPKTAQFIGGFANLQMDHAHTGAPQPRYKIQNINSRASVRSTQLMLHQTKAELAYGERHKKIDQDMPVFRTAGLTLVDQGAAENEQENVTSSNLKLSHKSDERSCLWAEDLIAGYRIDIGKVKGKSKRIEWRSLSERHVELPTQVEDFFEDDDPSSTPHPRDRDSVILRTGTNVQRSDKENAGANDLIGVTNTEIASYSGTALGLPALGQAVELSDEDLPVPMALDHPEDTVNAMDGTSVPNTLPDLRFGERYFVAARLGLINGGGLSWRDAYRKYYVNGHAANIDTVEESEVYAIGKNQATAFEFKRLEPVSPPDLHLAGGSMDVRRASEKSVNNPHPLDDNPNNGDQARVLVVRSGENQLSIDSSTRVVVPPRVSDDLSDQHGVNDYYNGFDQPPGAFTGFDLYPKSGAFPQLNDPNGEGDVECKPGRRDDDLPANANDGKASESVARPAPNGEVDPDCPYYPDPLAQRLCIGWAEVDQEIEPDSMTSASFYPDSDDMRPTEAQANLVQLTKGDGDKPLIVLNGWNDRPRDWKGLINSRLEVAVPPGMEVDVWLWCIPDNKKKENPHAIGATMQHYSRITELVRRVNGSLGPESLNVSAFLADLEHKARVLAGEIPGPKILMPENAKRAFLATMNELRLADIKIEESDEGDVLLPIANVFRHRKIRLLHAVQRPVFAPQIPLSTVYPGKHMIGITRLNMSGADLDSSDAINKKWSRYIETVEENAPHTWPNETNGTVAFVGGDLTFHRRSTEKLTVLAHWLNFDHSAAVRNRDSEFFFDPEPQTDRFLQIDGIPALTERENPNEVSLTRDEDKSLRALYHDFGDHKARTLRLQPIAASRFRAYFQELENKVPDAKTQIERDRQANLLRSHGVRQDWKRKLKDYVDARVPGPFVERGESIEIKLPATRRPLPPVIDRIEPSSVSVTRPDPKRNGTITEHISAARVHLKGEWYSSGEGEQLAIILWPETFGDPHSLNRFIQPRPGVRALNGLGSLEPYITRWGADSTVVSGEIEEMIFFNRYLDLEKEQHLLPGTKTLKGPLAMPLPAPTNTDLSSSRLMMHNSGASRENVYFVTYQPVLSPETGKWYCDIPFDHGDSYFPMVRFGLARFQPNAPRELRLSEPTSKWTQIAPWRRVNIFRSAENQNEVSIHVHGVGFTQKTIDLQGDQLAIAQRPHYEVRLMERQSGPSPSQIGPRPVFGVGGLDDTDACFDTVPTMDQAKRSMGQPYTTGMRWRYDQVTIPDASDEDLERYFLISEKTYHAADDPEDRMGSVIAAKLGATIKIGL